MLAAAALALALAAPPEKPPYLPPRVAPATDKLKCDAGTVLTVSAEKHQFQSTTPAGVVTYRASNDVQVFDRAGKPAGAIARLRAGDKVRVYYLVEDGARALEVDLE
ncbi:MAG TPA: hypothetical protein VH880_09350 [Anaeromyxobacteraceae bacterium]|jgi:hypothetical protein